MSLCTHLVCGNVNWSSPYLIKKRKVLIYLFFIHYYRRGRKTLYWSKRINKFELSVRSPKDSQTHLTKVMFQKRVIWA